MHVHGTSYARALRPVARIVVWAMVTAMVTVLGWAQFSAPASAAVVTIPQQGGNHSFEATPGMTVLAGYSFKYYAGKSTIINSGGAELSVKCKNGSTPSQTSLRVPMPYQEYLDPAPHSSGWSPSGDQGDPAVYQGSFVIGNYCAGTTMVIGDKMGPFTADVYSDVGQALDFRWHYGPASGPKSVVPNGSSWSATKNVVPDPLPELGADLAIAKTDAPDPVRRGQNLTYTLTVHNNSTVNPAQNVVVTDTLDANTSFVSSTPSATACTHSGQATGGTVTCSLGTVAAGASATVSITTTVASSAPADVVAGSSPSAGGAGTNCGTYDLCNRVSVTSTTTDPSPGNNSYFQPTNVIRPEIHLVKSVSDSNDADSVGSLGETLTYGFQVTNTGNVPLTNVMIGDPLFAPNTTTLCVANLAVGATVTCPARAYQVTQTDVDNHQVVNTATATGTPPGGGTVSDDDKATMPTKTDAAAIMLVKSVSDDPNDADLAGSLGETLTYSFQVTNTGNVELTNVTIHDPMFTPATTTCVAALAVGATATCPSRSYVVTADDISHGVVNNTATATGTPPAPGPDVTDTDPASIPTPATPAIHLVKSVADDPNDADSIGSLGETLTYSFTVKNSGNVPLTNVTISDPMFWPAAQSCVSYLAVGDTVTCPGLAPTHTVTATDISVGRVNNTATATGTPPAPGGNVTDTDDASIQTQTNSPAIHLEKSVADDPNDGDSIGSLGDTLTYSFAVTNTGNVPLTNVTIDDPMFWPAAQPCVSYLAVGQTATCPGLAPTYTVTADDVTATSVTNEATAFGQPPTGVNVYDADDAVMPTQPPNTQPDLSIDKTVDVSQAVPGQTVTYTVTVRNTGAGPASNVVVTDPLPSGTSFVSATAPCANSAGTVTCSLGTVAAGATITLTIKVKVDPATGPTSTHQHAFDYTKVETHLSVFDTDTTGTVQCPTGYVATDGGVRLDSVDQGGSFASVHVLASAVTPDGKGWTATVRNDNDGQAQAKVNVVCMTERTSSGESHTHPVVITGPAATTQALTPGHNEIDLACAAGTYPVQPSYVLSGGTASVGTRRTATGWRFVVEADTATSGTFAIHCLSKTLGTTSGHDHELLFQELSDTVSVPSGSVVERKLTCPDGYKGIVAWADLDPGLVSLGNDPQPITRVFKFYNPTGSALDADFGLLCVSIRTKGGNAGDADVTNTASLTSSSSDPTPGDHTDSATFTLNPTGVIVAPRAVVVTKAGRTQVRLAVTVSGKRTVTMKLVAAGKVGGTRIRAGSVLAQRRTTLGKGKATVALTARGSAGQVLRAGRVDRAKLVVVSHGHKSVRVIRLHR